MRHKPLKPPKGKKGIAKQLRWLSEHMIDIGTSMDYYGGFDERMTERGSELVGAGLIAKEWAKGIEDDLT